MNPKSNTPVNRNAKHTLTEDEIKKYNEQLLGALQAKKEIEAEKKEVAATYKNKIAEQELAIDKISNLMRVGYEIRPFSCYLVKNFEDGKREYYEFGSEKLVDTEPLNAGDYQLQIQDDEKAIQANNEAADLKGMAEPDYTETIGNMTIVINDEPEYQVEQDSNPLEYDEPVVLSEEELAIAEAGPETNPFEEFVQDIESSRKEVEIEDDPFALGDGRDEEDDAFSFDNI